MKSFLAGLLALCAASANAETYNDFLIQFKAPIARSSKIQLLSHLPNNAKVTELGLAGWTRVEMPKITAAGARSPQMTLSMLSQLPGVAHVQPNYKLKLVEQPGLQAARRMIMDRKLNLNDECQSPGACPESTEQKDNPLIPAPPQPEQGIDPLFNNQWGMLDIGVQQAWNKTRGKKDIVVAVIDTGIDYTHEDIVENLWRNKGEMGTDAQGQDKSTNGLDDDGNGYVDDLVGWDFVSNDSKPYDLSVSVFQLLFGGGNPGHGTHCAGNVAARGENGRGVSGVAPNVSIMALRFLSEKGEGTTADAVKAIMYAINNGAHITSNSWGSIGEDENEADNKALRDAIAASEAKGVLFIAAAGNGDPQTGQGYDNDTSNTPAYPASYPNDIIISVAALDADNQLGEFSNWGQNSVDIGAPGVKVFSTTVGGNYSDTVIDLGALGLHVTWDGTSMATPHVAGAAALYLSLNPSSSWKQVKAALLTSATAIASLSGKAVSQGKLNVDALLR